MKKKPSKPVSNPNFRGFINVELSAEDKTIIKSTSYDMSDYSSDLEKWIDSGYKFTFSQDTYNKCFQAIGTRQDSEHPDYGIMMSGRGSTPIKAFKQWVYIQTRLIGEATWSEMLQPLKQLDLDD